MVLKKYSLLLLFSVVMAHTSSAQSYQEYVALFELHYQTNGHDWNKKWNFDIPVYMWEGVTVENGHVVALDLSDNNLEGKIPLTFAYLKHLKHLNLSGNKLKGKLSRGFGKLVKLESLNLADNNLTGKLPKRLANLSKLKSLDLANNNFGDYTALAEIKKQQLRHFDMAEEFKHLNLMDSKEGVADIDFESED